MDTSKSIWESMLDADMNERYWTHLSRHYYKADRFIKIFLAIMTLGTVVSWGIWSHIEVLWKILSLIAAAVAITSPFLKLETTIERVSTLKGKWARVLNEYELLWLSRKDKEESELFEKYKERKEKEIEIGDEEKNLPINKKLILKIQDEVLKSRGISNQT